MGAPSTIPTFLALQAEVRRPAAGLTGILAAEAPTAAETSEPPIYIFCEDSDEEVDAPWTEPNVDAAEASSVVCAGENALTCMSSHEGIYVGSYQLAWTTYDLKHTAIASVPPPKVTELLGLLDHPIQTVAKNQPVPAYGGGFPGYKWVKVGELSQVDAMNRAIDKAIPEVEGDLYHGGSNMFIAGVLKYTGITLSKYQQLIIGNAIGICHCGNCSL
jgi:hypothetical protein